MGMSVSVLVKHPLPSCSPACPVPCQIPACPGCPWPCSQITKLSQFARTVLGGERGPCPCHPSEPLHQGRNSRGQSQCHPPCPQQDTVQWQCQPGGLGHSVAPCVHQGRSSRTFPVLGAPGNADAPGHILCPAPRAPAFRSVSPVV